LTGSECKLVWYK